VLISRRWSVARQVFIFLHDGPFITNYNLAKKSFLVWT
jgi:hypothetical protein